MKILQNRHNINIYPDNNFQHFMHKSYIPVKLVELDNIRDVRNETLVCSTKFKKKLKFINQPV
ncbi:hypothetical protein A3Q56_08638 [Intoshia linei]|uniref:Uncharacterized protein n=1 Tax=Intoshia linei TaxID=1819745 RepID=A0A177ANQ7_9BILA|nr:hypothetical protein A3Q56_08638 [Intoshia linei]